MPETTRRTEATHPLDIDAERAAFAAYLVAIARNCGHDATARETRLYCAAEFQAWSDACLAAYGERP